MERQKRLKELIDSLGDLGEINLVLRSLEESSLERWVLKSYILNSSGVTTRIPIPDILIDLAIELRLVEIRRQRKKEVIYLTNSGRELLKLKPIWADRLSDQQGRYLFSRILGETELLQDILSVINMLNTDSNENLWISCKDKRINSLEDRALRLLQQIRIAEFKEDIIFIDKENIEWLMDSICYGIAIDENTLLKILEQRKEHGLIAENFVVNFERERLCNCGRENLAKLVKKISTTNVSAGYDILSFDGASSEENPNRFIEVKGTSSDEVIFFISKNELEKAKNLQNKYWLYCVSNVKDEKLSKLKIIRNPYKAFCDTRGFEIEPVLWKVCVLNKSIYKKQFQDN